MRKLKKKVESIKAENRVVVASSWGLGIWGDIDKTVQSFSYVEWMTSGDLIHSMVTVVK